MPEYLAPGVYVEEIERGSKPIEGVGTHAAGFVGVAERGPVTAQDLRSVGEYRRLFGGPAGEGFLAHAISGFFANGGSRAFVARVCHGAAGTASLSVGGLRFEANGPGAWGSRVAVRLDPGADGRFSVTVHYWSEGPPADDGRVVSVDPDAAALDPALAADPDFRTPALSEAFLDLSMASDSPAYFVQALEASALIRVAAESIGNPPDQVPGAAPLTLLSAVESAPPTLEDYRGAATDPGQATGLAALEDIDELALICAPDEHDVPGLTDAVVTHCARLKDRFALLQAGRGARPVNEIMPPVDSRYAACYYPWLTIAGPDGVPIEVPPVGHVAGIYARSDQRWGVHKAPANEVVRGALGLQVSLSDADQEILNPRGVNCIRAFPGRGIRVWGARTTSSDPEWRYVNVRRLFLFLEASIWKGTQWVVFEPNDERVWAEVTRSVADFLLGVWQGGALTGTSPDQAFFVRCDRTTMTRNDLDNGRLVMQVGVAPLRPAEFVIFRIGQKTADA